MQNAKCKISGAILLNFRVLPSAAGLLHSAFCILHSSSFLPDEGPDENHPAAAGADGDFPRRPVDRCGGRRSGRFTASLSNAPRTARGSSIPSWRARARRWKRSWRIPPTSEPAWSAPSPTTICPGSSRTSTTMRPGAAPTPRPSGFTGLTARWSFPQPPGRGRRTARHPAAARCLRRPRTPAPDAFLPALLAGLPGNQRRHRARIRRRRAQGHAAGFLFRRARVERRDGLKSLASDTDNHLQFLPAIPSPHEATTEDDADKGIISSTHTLGGWDGRPVTRLLVCNDSDTSVELSHSTHLLLVLLVGFALAVAAAADGAPDAVGQPAAAAHLPDARDRAARAHRQAARRPAASSAAWQS